MTETSAAAWAELEIGIMPGTDGNYNVQLVFHDSDGGDFKTPVVQVALPHDNLKQFLLDIPAYGNALSQALFTELPIRDTFLQALTIASRLKVSLRLRFVLDASLPQVHALLWETLIDPRDTSLPLTQRGTLATNQDMLFSRYVSGAHWQPVTIPPRSDLRALVVIANPTNIEQYHGLSPIDVQAEQCLAQDSLQGIASVTTLASGGQATVRTINHRLLDGYHILYLVAHGGVIKGRTWLWLENEHSAVAVVEAAELVKVLADMGRRRPLLVVLVSCQSGVTSTEVLLDDGEQAETAAPVKHAALAVRLMEAGIPAVLAMQDNLTMETARAFLPIFFQELQRHGQVDYAVTAARGVTRQRHDWWVPVLFQRVQNGRIWKEGEPAASDAAPSSAPAAITPSSISQETIDQRKLREKMHELFSLEDLDVVCKNVELSLRDQGKDLQVNLEVVGGSGKKSKILNLIDYLYRRGLLAHLVVAVMEERPELRLEDIT